MSCSLGVVVGLEDFVVCLLSNIDLPIHGPEPIVVVLPLLGDPSVIGLLEE